MSSRSHGRRDVRNEPVVLVDRQLQPIVLMVDRDQMYTAEEYAGLFGYHFAEPRYTVGGDWRNGPAGFRVTEVEVGLAHRATGTGLRAQLHRAHQLADVARALAVRR